MLLVSVKPANKWYPGVVVTSDSSLQIISFSRENFVSNEVYNPYPLATIVESLKYLSRCRRIV